MEARRLGWTERVTRVCDLLYTMNFVTVAKVRGDFGAQQLRAALDRMQIRHPLLAASVRRRGLTLWYEPGEAPPIAMLWLDAKPSEWQFHAEGLLGHETWGPKDPRGKLVCLAHGEAHRTLLWSMHHVGGDGTSGMVFMRDLLALLGGEQIPGEPLPAPAQEVFHPPQLRASGRPRFALNFAAGELKHGPARMFTRKEDAPTHTRRNGVVLRSYESDALRDEARSLGATIHGLLTARHVGVARARIGGGGTVTVMHPVDLRRMLRDPRHGATLPEGLSDMVGTFVSYVQTRHRMRGREDERELSQEVSRSIGAQKAAGTPVLTSPFLGRVLVLLSALLPTDWLRRLAERQLSANTLGITNLGPLESLGLRPRFGDLEVDEVFFAATPSISAQVCSAVSSFRGTTHVCAVYVDPLVPEEVATALAESAGSPGQAPRAEPSPERARD